MKIFFFIVLSAIGMSLHGQSYFKNFKTEVGEQLPGFQLISSKGHISEIEDYRGKPLLLLFFGTHCGPCMKKLPIINERIAKKYSKDELTIIAVAASNNQFDVDKFEEKWKYNFIYVPDPEQKIFNLFAWNTIPRNILVDKNGKILFQSLGHNKSPFENMVSMIEREVAR